MRARVALLTAALGLLTPLAATAAVTGPHTAPQTGRAPAVRSGARPTAVPTVSQLACSWDLRSNPDTVNVAYPDTSAYYWSHQLAVVPGTKLVVTGDYPDARYFSFHVYDASAVAMDSIYDTQLAPDPGSANPYRAAVPAHDSDHYTLTVSFTKRPSRPAPNTVYLLDTPQGVPSGEGTLMYRVYVPASAADPAGNVPLPSVTLETTAGKALVHFGACSDDLPDTGVGVNKTITSANWSSKVPVPPTPGAEATPAWSRAYGNNLYGLFGNDQNAYLTASISRTFGDLVVVHAKAPTFPNTLAGQGAYLPRQVRYWSLCENNLTTRVIDCAPDYQVSLRDGFYTYVISDPDVRPANAISADGVTWLAWGGTFPDGVLIFRTMLPAASFHHAVQDVAKGQSPAAVLGAYYPQALYCAPTVFAHGGWAGCVDAAR